MEITYKVTNTELFNRLVFGIRVSEDMEHGDGINIEIELNPAGISAWEKLHKTKWPQGKHSLQYSGQIKDNAYEKEYGFILVRQ